MKKLLNTLIIINYQDPMTLKGIKYHTYASTFISDYYTCYGIYNFAKGRSTKKLTTSSKQLSRLHPPEGVRPNDSAICKHDDKVKLPQCSFVSEKQTSKMEAAQTEALMFRARRLGYHKRLS